MTKIIYVHMYNVHGYWTTCIYISFQQGSDDQPVLRLLGVCYSIHLNPEVLQVVEVFRI